MIYISAQPDNDYFVWQLRVQIANLESLGNKLDYHILVRYQDSINPNFLELAKELYKNGHIQYKFFFYKENRADWGAYLQSLRPWMLAQHFEFLSISECFYIDSDIIFRELINFEILKDNCYTSDTISYVGANYIKSKSDKLFEEMCQIVGIEPTIVEDKEVDSGGAQYVMRGSACTQQFWEKVNRDCVKLYYAMINFNRTFTGHGIQAWTSDMWAVLWNLWLVGDCKVHHELDFCWPGDRHNRWYATKIMHNAGVTEDDAHKYFFKGGFIKNSPIGLNLEFVDKESCSYKYVQAIKQLEYGY